MHRLNFVKNIYNMNNQSIKQTLEHIKEIRQWDDYLNKERFISHAKVKRNGYDAEKVWKIWTYITELNWYNLEGVSEDTITKVTDLAREIYESVCCGAHVHYRDEQPKTNRWRVYYNREEDESDIQQTEVDLLNKEDVLKYAALLQQKDVTILYRLDYFETVEKYGQGREETDIYDGDIIFCTDKEKNMWSDDNSGAYLCIDGCYKRMLYTPGRGYLRRGEPDFEQENDKDVRYRSYVFNSYDRKFKVVGNIHVDNSILNEKKKEEEK